MHIYRAIKKKVTLSHVYEEVVSLQSRDIQQLEGKFSHFAGHRTPFAVESSFCNSVSPGGGGPKHFPASITNKL
jgi:hypothetical protein